MLSGVYFAVIKHFSKRTNIIQGINGKCKLLKIFNTKCCMLNVTMVSHNFTIGIKRKGRGFGNLETKYLKKIEQTMALLCPTCCWRKRNWRFKLLTSMVSKSIFGVKKRKYNDLQFRHLQTRWEPNFLAARSQCLQHQQQEFCMFLVCGPHQRQARAWCARTLCSLCLTKFWSNKNLHTNNFKHDTANQSHILCRVL